MTEERYVPQRRDLIWLDFEPAKGREIGKRRPALVLSSGSYNQRTGLLICCPISTQIRGTRTEVPVSELDQPCVIAASLVQTLAWKERNAKKITRTSRHTHHEALRRLLPLMGAAGVLESQENS